MRTAIQTHQKEEPEIARQHRINQEITAPQVRVIGEENTQLGVMSTRDALRTAREAGLDLVEISPQATPPVCRLADYGKLRYEASKRQKKNRSAQKGGELKEIRLRPHIGQEDLETKLKKIREFIAGGNKVRLNVRFRGREITRQQDGLTLLRRIANELKEEVRLEAPPQSAGRSISMTMVPGKKAGQGEP